MPYQKIFQNAYKYNTISELGRYLVKTVLQNNQTFLQFDGSQSLVITTAKIEIGFVNDMIHFVQAAVRSLITMMNENDRIDQIKRSATTESIKAELYDQGIKLIFYKKNVKTYSILSNPFYLNILCGVRIDLVFKYWNCSFILTNYQSFLFL